MTLINMTMSGVAETDTYDLQADTPDLIRSGNKDKASEQDVENRFHL